MSRIRRLEIPGAIYHVVFKTTDEAPTLTGSSADCVAEEIIALESDGLAQVLAWSIMSTHVHILLAPANGKLSKVVHRIKGRTAYKLGKRHREMKKIWVRRYYDRRIRNDKQREEAERYIIENPVKAGLCERPEEWAWSSVNPRFEKTDPHTRCGLPNPAD